MPTQGVFTMRINMSITRLLFNQISRMVIITALLLRNYQKKEEAIDKQYST